MQTQPSPENKARAHLQKADSLVLWGSAVTDTTFAWIVIWVLVVCIEGYRYAYRLALFWPLLMGVNELLLCIGRWHIQQAYRSSKHLQQHCPPPPGLLG